jgi:hypothetical protein
MTGARCEEVFQVMLVGNAVGHRVGDLATGCRVRRDVWWFMAVVMVHFPRLGKINNSLIHSENYKFTGG